MYPGAILWGTEDRVEPAAPADPDCGPGSRERQAATAATAVMLQGIQMVVMVVMAGTAEPMV